LACRALCSARRRLCFPDNDQKWLGTIDGRWGYRNVIGRIGRSNQKGHQTWLQDHSGTKNGYSSLRTSRAPVLEIGEPSFVLKTCYAIIKTRRDGLETKISLVMDDSGSQYLSFAIREEARAWIRRLVQGPMNYL